MPPPVQFALLQPDTSAYIAEKHIYREAIEYKSYIAVGKIE